MEDNSGQIEPRGDSGKTVESEYSIAHPLIIDNRLPHLINSRAMNLFVESVKCIQDGDEIKAARLFKEAEKEDPSIHYRARDALVDLSRNCMPQDEGAIYYWIGIHSQYLQESDQAIIWYKKAIEAFQKSGFRKREGRAHCNLGTVKMQLQDPSGLEEYIKAVKLNPADGIAHICIGVARYSANDREGALDAFADAVSADPDRYGPHVIIRLQILGSDWQDDVTNIALRIAKRQGIDLQKEAERDNYFRAGELIQLGNRLFQTNKYMEALQIFEKGKTLFPEIPSFYLGISMVTMQYIELRLISPDQIPDYLQKAETNINECLRLAPDNYEYIHAKEIIEEYKHKYQRP